MIHYDKNRSFIVLSTLTSAKQEGKRLTLMVHDIEKGNTYRQVTGLGGFSRAE